MDSDDELFDEADEEAAAVLVEAIEDHDVERMRDLLELGVSANTPDPCTGITPLMAAVIARNLRAVKMLLKHGADPDLLSETIDSTSHVLEAAVQCDTQMLKLLLKAGASITDDDRSPLLLAQNGLVEEIAVAATSLLLEAGACPHVEDLEGMTALHHAKFADAITLLAGAGANPNARNWCGEMPLHVRCTEAYGSGGRAAIKALLDCGADVNAPIKPTGSREFRPAYLKGSTALHISAHRGDIEVVKMLPARGANVHVFDTLKRSPMRMAVGVITPSLHPIVQYPLARPDYLQVIKALRNAAAWKRRCAAVGFYHSLQGKHALTTE